MALHSAPTLVHQCGCVRAQKDHTGSSRRQEKSVPGLHHNQNILRVLRKLHSLLRLSLPSKRRGDNNNLPYCAHPAVCKFYEQSKDRKTNSRQLTQEIDHNNVVSARRADVKVPNINPPLALAPQRSCTGPGVQVPPAAVPDSCWWPSSSTNRTLC